MRDARGEAMDVDEAADLKGEMNEGLIGFVEVVGGGSAAAGVVQGLGGAVRARGLIGGSASGLDRGTTLGFCVLGGQD